MTAEGVLVSYLGTYEYMYSRTIIEYVRRDPYKFAYVIGKLLTSQSETPCFSADRLIFV